MSLWRHATRGLRVLTNRQSADRELADELSHYADQSAAERIARGAPPESARRAAILEMGNLTVAREEIRSHGWEHVVGTLAGDLRYGARRLRQNPGFTVVCVVTLALGIGASTAIFSAVNPILFGSLPYPEPSRIVMISDVTQDGQPLDVTFGTYLELVRRSHSFEVVAPLDSWQPALTGNAEPERLSGQRVGAGFFQALGALPAIGRCFTPDDDRPNGPHVVILGNALWRKRFAADPTIIGQTVRLNADDYTVIGVMPANFENVLAPLADVWTPLQYNLVFDDQSREWGHHLRVVSRLRPGVNVESAKRELARIAATPVADFPRVPWASLGNGLTVTSLQSDMSRGIRPVLIAVLVAVALVLAIVCANVTNLILARSAQRRGEFALRAALGAGRTRLLRQVITESVALALIGGALGLVVAALGVKALVALSPVELPRLGAIRLDGAVFSFALLLTVSVGVLVGLLPAFGAGNSELRSGVQESSQRTAGSHQRTRGVLVVAEVAIALVLLISAGLLLKSIARVLSVPIGFDSSHLLTMEVQETGIRFRADSTASARVDSARYLFYSEALDAVRQLPGVTSAAFTSLLPLSGDMDTYGVHFEKDPDPKDDGAAMRYAVTPGFFDAMNIPLQSGRLLDARDGPGAPRAVLINESFARSKFSTNSAIGQRLRFGPNEGDWYTVVGIVGDVKQSSLDVSPPVNIYVSPTQWHWVDNSMSLVIRARGDAASQLPAIRGAIWSVDKDQPIGRVATMLELVDRSVADKHFALVLFEAFGLTALVLAGIGIYGVLSGSVAERRRELGVRAALGASPSSIIALVLRRGMTLTVVGVAMGLIAASLATRVMVSMLFNVSRLDPITYLSVIALLTSVSAIACGLPAVRAARVDPASTLKAS